MKANIRGIILAILGDFGFFGYFLLRFDRSEEKNGSSICHINNENIKILIL